MFLVNNLIGSTKESSLTTSKTYSSVYVLVYDKNNTKIKINCSLNTQDTEGYLEMHFIQSGFYDDAILIRTKTTTIFIDGGRYNAKKKVITYLEEAGVKTIDALIGSHPHYDHIQAQGPIIDTFSVKHTYYTVDLNTCASKKTCTKEDVKYVLDSIKSKNIPMTVTYPGNRYTVGDITLYMLGPYKLTSSSSPQNANSHVMILKYRNTTYMFTGDAPSSVLSLKQVKQYAEKLGISLKVDMFKYPHHGNASLDWDLMDVVKPQYVIVPNYKKGDRPISSNKSKLKKLGATIYESYKDGNIVLVSDGNKITVKTNQSASNYKR